MGLIKAFQLLLLASRVVVLFDFFSDDSDSVSFTLLMGLVFVC